MKYILWASLFVFIMVLNQANELKLKALKYDNKSLELQNEMLYTFIRMELDVMLNHKEQMEYLYDELWKARYTAIQSSIKSFLNAKAIQRIEERL